LRRPCGAKAPPRAALRPPAERRAAWLTPAIDAVQPVLVHAHFGWAAVDALPSARMLGLPLVASFHGTDVTVSSRTPRGQAEYPRLFGGVDRAIVSSHYLAGRLRELGYNDGVEIVPPGVDLERIRFGSAPRPDGPPRLLFVGRQVPVKGLDLLLRTLPSLVSRHPDVRLDVIGDGPDAEANAALARRLGVGRQVRFHGALPHDEVLRAMRAAQVLVVPGRTTAEGQAEGFGLIAVEAQAAGLPVVACASGGLPETIAPEHRGELVQEGDHVALAERVSELLAEPGRWPERTAAARKWVEREFDWDLLVPRLGAVYESVLAARVEGRARRVAASA
jgi:colanic acid/amylovoran biosynthesis glycosyltransferase